MASQWLIKRVGHAVFTIYAVVTLSFLLIRWMPGGPMNYMAAQMMEGGGEMNPTVVREYMELYMNLNPQKPIPIAYFEYVTSVFQGDLGQSVWFNAPVTDILAGALPWTVFLMGTSTILSFMIGLSLGAVMAFKHGSRFDSFMTTLGTVVNSVPFFLLAILLLVFFAYLYPIFPDGGKLPRGVEPAWTLEFFRGVLYHAALPILSVVLTGWGGKSLAMRGNSIQVLGSEYLRVARVRGLDSNHLALWYVGRNAVLPMYTGFLISIGFMFGGAIILEDIFSYPGVGFYMFKAINARDYPLMMGAFIVITFAVVIALVFADLTYSKIDPRAGVGDRESY